MTMTTHVAWNEARALAGRLLCETLRSTGSLLQRLASPAEDEPHHRCGCGCCTIPETECPPRCVGPIDLGAMTGQTVTAVVTVVNRAAAARTFAFGSTPYQYGTSSASFTFAPATLALAPGTSGSTVASLTIPTDFVQGTYDAEILVNASPGYEQCVRVRLEVGCKDARSAHAEVVQLDAPFRIRAHQWYDHFQCYEPCEPQPGTVRPPVPGRAG
jgi:hypothetical protein